MLLPAVVFALCVLAAQSAAHDGIQYRDAECGTPCGTGRCRFTGCAEGEATCPGGLCEFVDCVAPDCSGGAPTRRTDPPVVRPGGRAAAGHTYRNA